MFSAYYIISTIQRPISFKEAFSQTISYLGPYAGPTDRFAFDFFVLLLRILPPKDEDFLVLSCDVGPTLYLCNMGPTLFEMGTTVL